MTNFAQGLYDSSLAALLEHGVREDLAVAASKIVADDDASKPDLGRTPEDQEIINQAMAHYHAFGDKDGYNREYVQERYTRYLNSLRQSYKDNCLYRIGTHLDLDLPLSGELSEAHRQQIRRAVTAFLGDNENAA